MTREWDRSFASLRMTFRGRRGLLVILSVAKDPNHSRYNHRAFRRMEGPHVAGTPVWSVHLRARRLPRPSRHFEGAAASAHAAHGRYQRHLGHLSGGLAGCRRGGLRAGGDLARLRRSDLRHDQHGRRLPDHRPHAPHVPEAGQVVAEHWIPLAYLVASVCFILTLQLLSSPKHARMGNAIGSFGMLVAVVGTLL